MSKDRFDAYLECVSCDHLVVSGVACDHCPQRVGQAENGTYNTAHQKVSYRETLEILTVVSDPDDPECEIAVRGWE